MILVAWLNSYRSCQYLPIIMALWLPFVGCWMDPSNGNLRLSMVQRMQHTIKSKRYIFRFGSLCACGPSRRSVHVVKFEEVAVAIAHCPISAIWNFLVRTIHEGIGTLKVGVHFPPEVWEKKDAQKERRYEIKMAGRKDMRNWREEISTKRTKDLTKPKPLR